MTRKGTVGNCAVYPSNYPTGIMHSDLLRVRVDNKLVLPIFLSYQFKLNLNIVRQISKISGGAVMPGINVSKLKSISLVIPPLHLQQRFACIVRQMEMLRLQFNQSKKEADDLFNDLMQKAFKGELII